MPEVIAPETVSANTPVLIVAGPTASGKSALALELARRYRGCIINADALQLYADLPILTASPTAAEQENIPHQLYGVLPATQRSSAGFWQQEALKAMAQARAQGLMPILVGGTGLYLRTLLQGLADIPPVPDAVRQHVQARLTQAGLAQLYLELQQGDPLLAERLPPTDTQRIVRGLEVLLASGRPLTYWQQQTIRPAGYDYFSLVLLPPRAKLYAKCDARFMAMLQAGALDEVRALMQQELPDDAPIWQALGARELRLHLQGEVDLSAAITVAQQATRHYAKRQVTWFTHQLAAKQPSLIVSDATMPLENILQHLPKGFC